VRIKYHGVIPISVYIVITASGDLEVFRSMRKAKWYMKKCLGNSPYCSGPIKYSVRVEPFAMIKVGE